MWLLVVIIFMACSGVYKLLRDQHIENKRRDEAIREGRDYYFDRNWYMTDVNTNISYYLKSDYSKDSKRMDHKGDCYVINAYTGQVMRNITQELRDKYNAEAEVRKQEAIKSGERYYICEYPQKWDGGGQLYKRFMEYKHEEIPCAPAMFMDLETGKRYLICQIYYDEHKRDFKYPIHRFIGMGMWDVEEKKFVKLYDEENISENNIKKCWMYLDIYDELHSYRVGSMSDHLRWVDSLDHKPFYVIEGRC